jgi:transposase
MILTLTFLGRFLVSTPALAGIAPNSIYLNTIFTVSRNRIAPPIIKKILHYKWVEKLSNRQIALKCRIARSTVASYLTQSQSSSFSKSQLLTLEESDLPNIFKDKLHSNPQPYWQDLYWQLKNKGTTRLQFWEKYKKGKTTYIKYSRFCDLYQQWFCQLDKTLRQTFMGSENLLVDYIDKTINIIDKETGEVFEANVFVGILGATGYAFAEATWTRSNQDFIASHIKLLEYLEGCTDKLLLKKNAKRCINKTKDENSNIYCLAEHYQINIITHLSHHSKESPYAGITVFKRWLQAKLRRSLFHKIDELNDEIQKLLKIFNNYPFNRQEGTREKFFKAYERDQLKPLPSTSFIYVEWKKVHVGPNLHVNIYGHFYSVPCKMAGFELEASITSFKIEIYHFKKLVAIHQRNNSKNRYTTDPSHIPFPEKSYAGWSPTRFLNWASTHGPATVALIKTTLVARPYPQHAFGTCFGILGLGKKHGPEHLEKACTIALKEGNYTYRHIKILIENNPTNGGRINRNTK